MKKGGLGNPLINLQDTTTNLLQPSLLKNHKPKLNLTGNYNFNTDIINIPLKTGIIVETSLKYKKKRIIGKITEKEIDEKVNKVLNKLFDNNIHYTINFGIKKGGEPNDYNIIKYYNKNSLSKLNCFKKIGGILNNYYNNATISEGSYNNSLILLQLSEDTQNTFGNLYFVTKVLRENNSEKYITFIRKCNKSFVDSDYIIDEIKLMTKLNNLYYSNNFTKHIPFPFISWFNIKEKYVDIEKCEGNLSELFKILNQKKIKKIGGNPNVLKHDTIFYHIFQQIILNIFIFHNYAKKTHLDTHLGNFLYSLIDTPQTVKYNINKKYEIYINCKKVIIYLTDFGQAKNIDQEFGTTIGRIDNKKDRAFLYYDFKQIIDSITEINWVCPNNDKIKFWIKIFKDILEEAKNESDALNTSKHFDSILLEKLIKNSLFDTPPMYQLINGLEINI
tara:strand:- start:7165 stop:8505 length:1341 start_codon:yes stop_codon:yes gene_type:complete